MTVMSIESHAADLLEKAAQAGNGRAATTVYGRQGARLRQTLVALTEGNVLGEHKSPGDASLYCLRGRVLVRSSEGQHELATGDLVPIPPQRHDVEALETSLLLLSVAIH